MDTTTLVVAVPTFRRPGLLEASLPAILDQAHEVSVAAEPPVRAHLLVIDNDPDATARETVTRLAATAPVPLLYVHEPVPGISAARNRALEDARDEDLLVFIDDDESPKPRWLAALVEAWRDTGATAVMGRVESVFAHDPDPFIVAGGFFSRAHRTTGTVIPAAAAGNLLLDLQQVRRTGVRFDPRLGLSGGEDTLFSRQLVAAGATLVWCEESEADDHVPAERLTKQWVLTRARRAGNSWVTAELLLAEAAGRSASSVRVRWLAGGLVRVVAGIGRTLVGHCVRSLRHQALGHRTRSRGLGMMAAALGRVQYEYARTGQVALR